MGSKNSPAGTESQLARLPFRASALLLAALCTGACTKIGFFVPSATGDSPALTIQEAQAAFYEAERVQYVATADLNSDGEQEIVCVTLDYAPPAPYDEDVSHIVFLYVLKGEFAEYARSLDPGMVFHQIPQQYVISREGLYEWFERLCLISLDRDPILEIIVQCGGGAHASYVDIYRLSKEGTVCRLLKTEYGLMWITDRKIVANGTEIGPGRTKLLIVDRDYSRDEFNAAYAIIYSMKDGVLERHGEFDYEALDEATQKARDTDFDERYRVLGTEKKYYPWRKEEIWREYKARKLGANHDTR